MATAGESKPLLEGKDVKNHVPRTVTLWSLVALTYFAIAGGPEGTETMVQTAGPFNAILGILIVGILWSIPTAMMTAELSTAFPENGGFTLWVRAAFGDFFGEMAGWLQFVSGTPSLRTGCAMSSADLAYRAARCRGCCTVPRALRRVPGAGSVLPIRCALSGTDKVAPLPGAGLGGNAPCSVVDSADSLRCSARSAQPGMQLRCPPLSALAADAACCAIQAGIAQVGHGSILFMCLLLTPFAVIIFIAFTGVFNGTTITVGTTVFLCARCSVLETDGAYDAIRAGSSSPRTSSRLCPT